MSLIKIGLRDLRTQEKAAYARRISEGLKSTPVFADEKELILNLDAARHALKKAIKLAAFGDKRALEMRRQAEKDLDEILRNAAAFVNHEAKGDTDLIQSAGFELRKRNNKPMPLSHPINFQVKRTNHSGELVLSWKPVKNSRNYLVQTSTRKPDGDTTWNTAVFSTRSRCTLDTLKPGTIYWIRVLAVGTKGMSPPSEIVKIMAA